MTDGGSWGLPALHAPALKWWLPLVLTPVLLVGFQYRRALPALARRAYVALLAGTIVAFGALIALRARSNVISPPEWDVQAFWLYGRVAATGQNFYLPSVFHEVARPLQSGDVPLTSSDVFRREALDVGFPYPPPTILLVAPLGRLDLRTAALAWYVVHALALVAAIVLLWRTFFEREDLLALALTAALTLTLRSTYSTVAFGQTNFLVLLLLVLFWRTRDRPAGGAFAALGMAVKPVMAILLAYTVLRRGWRSLSVTAGALAALSLVVLAAFGPEPFVTYFSGANPVGRVPGWLYTEETNQSLAATFVRVTGYDFRRGTPLVQPAFVATVAAVLGTTLWLAARLVRERGALALALLVPAALLVYPQSLENYTVLLLVPMLFVFTRREELGIGPWFAVAFVTAEYALIRAREGHVAVLANALHWLLLVGIGLRVASQQATERRARPAAGLTTPGAPLPR